MTPVEQIKSRLDIVEVVGGYIKLQRAGINLKARCPFHNEKTPSFFVSPARQTWHCFGCSKGGDIFSFVQEIEGMEFPEALRILAQRAGVELVHESRERRDARSRLFEANELAVKFFETQLLKSPAGGRALAYLRDRGLRDETIHAFRLGWAPEAQDALLVFLRGRGFSDKALDEVGLATRARDGFRARFRGRIMFPIFDGSNRTVGFTGRIFGREEGEYDPKYLNTPETPIFEKHRILYGLSAARKEIRRRGVALLVEGQMDCLLAHQATSAHAVATSGTALSPQHLVVLKRLADTVIFSYDADVAGIEAAKRGIDLALEAGFIVRLAVVPKGKDPADLIRDDIAAWQELLEHGTQPIIGFLLEQALAAHGLASPEAKRAVVTAVFPAIARISNTIERAEWLEQVRLRLGMTQANAEAFWQEVVKHEVKSIEAPQVSSEQDRPLPKEILSRRELLEEHLVALTMLQEQLNDLGDETIVRSSRNRALYRVALTAVQPAEGAPLAIPERVSRFQDAIAEEFKPYGERIVFMIEEMAESIRDLLEERNACLREIRTLDLRERLEAISTELEAAERSGDFARTRELTERFRESSANLAALFSEKSRATETVS